MIKKRKRQTSGPQGSEKAGAVPREISPVNDAADIKQVETALSENKKFLQAIIEAEPECVKLVASDGTLIMMNRAGLEMIQVDSPDQARGKSIYPLRCAGIS